jgi:hypothetical protein
MFRHFLQQLGQEHQSFLQKHPAHPANQLKGGLELIRVGMLRNNQGGFQPNNTGI